MNPQFLGIEKRLDALEKRIEFTDAEVAQRVGRKIGRDIGILYGLVAGLVIFYLLNILRFILTYGGERKMFKFEKEQQVWDFNRTTSVDKPGGDPTVLAASIFYNKHEIVLDDKTGRIDKPKAEALWARCGSLRYREHPALHPDPCRVPAGDGEVHRVVRRHRQEDGLPHGLLGAHRYGRGMQVQSPR